MPRHPDPRLTGVLPTGTICVPPYHWLIVRVVLHGPSLVFIGGYN